MSAFTGPLSLTHLDADWRLWSLNEPLVYEVGALGSGRVVTAPAGMRTDGASVPQILWAFLPAWGRYSRAAVIHDFLCNCLAATPLDPATLAALATAFPDGLNRRVADGVFLEAMAVCGTGWLARHIMWAAVRLYAVVNRLDNHFLSFPAETT